MYDNYHGVRIGVNHRFPKMTSVDILTTLNLEAVMKPAHYWILFLMISLSCNLPFGASEPASTLTGKNVDISGSWHGTLEDFTSKTTLEMNLQIQKTEKGFVGTVDFLEDGVIRESYQISGEQRDDGFQFSEAEGRSFWGTLDQGVIHGFVGWNCFQCDSWGKFTLSHQTDLDPAATSPAGSTSPGLIRFESLSDGATIVGTTDPVTGLPSATVRVISQDSSMPVFLDADGISSGYYYDPTQSSTTMDIQWTPWHGNGLYLLDLHLVEWTSAAGSIVEQQSITVNVTGIPDGTPTVEERFSQLFLERYGFQPTNPAFTRYIRLFPDAVDASRWVSAIYYNDYLYELQLMDDGSVSQFYTYTNFDNDYDICRPSGIIRMLAVIVDYGNTDIDQNAVVADLNQSVAAANQRWADYSTSMGLSQPILQVELVTALAGAPSIPGQYLTADEVRNRTGYDPAQFDLLTEVDLDRDNLATGQYGGLGVSLTGGCRSSGATRTNIAMNMSSSVDGFIGESIFGHELIHALGWQHWWSNGNGSTADWAEFGGIWMPYRMFGWMDLDGDGIIEIQDSTPYGIQ
jgi:hypothetical protein